MHFIKLGESYINLDNVTTIQPHENHLDYVVCFAGRNDCCLISAADMADIRREFEKIKKLQDLDKIVLKTDEEAKAEKETECVGCVWNKRRADGYYECTGHHVCSVKLGLRLGVHKE